MIDRSEWTEEGIQQVATLDEAITASSDVSVFILADLNLFVSAHDSLRARIQAGSSGEGHSNKRRKESLPRLGRGRVACKPGVKASGAGGRGSRVRVQVGLGLLCYKYSGPHAAETRCSLHSRDR